jgi:hypothetical protein
MQVAVATYDDALDAYFRALESEGGIAVQPAHDPDSYDEELGGWVFSNVNGPLALVRDDGSVVCPMRDPETDEWVFPRDEG